MSNLNRLKVVDFTAGRLSSDDINTDIPFTDNFDKTRTIQQANAVIGAYVNRNYKDMQNKADIDDIPTKTSQLENDSGYITSANIPTKTSELENDSGFITSADVPTKTSELDNDSGFITSASVPTKTSELNNDSGFITNADIIVGGSTATTTLNGNTDLDYSLSLTIPSGYQALGLVGYYIHGAYSTRVTITGAYLYNSTTAKFIGRNMGNDTATLSIDVFVLYIKV